MTTYIVPVEKQPIFPRLDVNNQPVAITWHKHEHRIECISNSYRVPSGTLESPIWREYFQIVTNTGWMLLIYHDLLDGVWGLEFVYD